MRLDFTRPYAEVIGRPGVAYEQDGQNFRPDGQLAEVPAAVVVTQPPAPVPSKPAPRAPHKKQMLRAETILRHQFGGDDDPHMSPVEVAIRGMQRDTLAPYRDPQNPDGSMKIEPPAWADGV